MDKSPPATPTSPLVPIDVNPATGVWNTDGLPMLYVPRHFFNNLHLGMEELAGREAYRDNLYQSGYKSAWFWCQKTAQEHDLEPIACYQFYLRRLSERGWGQFELRDQQLAQGHALVAVSNSSFVLHKDNFHIADTTSACYMFEGWFAGAADWVSETSAWSTRYQCHESQCAALHDTNTCLFKVSTTADNQQ